MTRFVQLHFLTVYPPSNPNRDDLGRPKTAIYGGVPRLRLSSQSLKRAARISDAMREGLSGHMGKRTQRIGDEVRSRLLDQGAGEKEASKIAKDIADIFGKLDEAAIKKDPAHVRIRQLAFVSPDERRVAFEWADRMLAGEFDTEAGRPLREKRLELPPGSMVYINARIFHAVEPKPTDSPQPYRIFNIDIFKEAGPPHRYTQEIPAEWMARANPARKKLFMREAYTESCWNSL